ncbi:hypothetical protein SMICM304S_09458 [Streptomyces microflavus]
MGMEYAPMAAESRQPARKSLDGEHERLAARGLGGGLRSSRVRSSLASGSRLPGALDRAASAPVPVDSGSPVPVVLRTEVGSAVPPFG